MKMALLSVNMIIPWEPTPLAISSWQDVVNIWKILCVAALG